MQAPKSLIFAVFLFYMALKRMLGVYLEQNATTEKYEDYDGERWVIFND